MAEKNNNNINLVYASTLQDYQHEVDRYLLLQTKFRKACQQVVLLNNRVLDAQARYDRAFSENSRSFHYTLRLKLVTLEGVRNMVYEYARLRADQLDALREKLIFLGLMEAGPSEQREDEVQ